MRAISFLTVGLVALVSAMVAQGSVSSLGSSPWTNATLIFSNFGEQSWCSGNATNTTVKQGECVRLTDLAYVKATCHTHRRLKRTVYRGASCGGTAVDARHISCGACQNWNGNRHVYNCGADSVTQIRCPACSTSKGCTEEVVLPLGKCTTYFSPQLNATVSAQVEAFYEEAALVHFLEYDAGACNGEKAIHDTVYNGQCFTSFSGSNYGAFTCASN